MSAPGKIDDQGDSELTVVEVEVLRLGPDARLAAGRLGRVTRETRTLPGWYHAREVMP